MRTNPLHVMIHLLDTFADAVMSLGSAREQYTKTNALHRAEARFEANPLITQAHVEEDWERAQQALSAYAAINQPFWDHHQFPDEAIRNLADPALKWLRDQGLTDRADADLVEQAARCIVHMAMTRNATNQANELTAQARQSRFNLRHLAARGGAPWNSGSPSGQAGMGVMNIPEPDFVPVPETQIEPAINALFTIFQGYPLDTLEGEGIVVGQLLQSHAEKHGVTQAALAWAIHRLIQRGELIAEQGWRMWPMSFPKGGDIVGGEVHPLEGFSDLKIRTTKQLWEHLAAISTSEKPVWDREKRELRYGKAISKKYERQKAEHQTTILDSFQELEWPSAIDNPIGNDAKQLGDAIRRLNEQNTLLEFFRNGTGTQIGWHPRQAPLK